MPCNSKSALHSIIRPFCHLTHAENYFPQFYCLPSRAATLYGTGRGYHWGEGFKIGTSSVDDDVGLEVGDLRVGPDP